MAFISSVNSQVGAPVLPELPQPYHAHQAGAPVSDYHDFRRVRNEPVEALLKQTDSLAQFVRSWYQSSCQLVYKGIDGDLLLGTAGFINNNINVVLTTRHGIDFLPQQNLYVRLYDYDKSPVFYDRPVRLDSVAQAGLDACFLQVDHDDVSRGYCRAVQADYSENALCSGHYVMIHFAGGKQCVSVGQLDHGDSYESLTDLLTIQAGNQSSGALLLWQNLVGDVSAKAMSYYRYLDSGTPQRLLITCRDLLGKGYSNSIKNPYDSLAKGCVDPVLLGNPNTTNGYEYLFFYDDCIKDPSSAIQYYQLFLLKEYQRVIFQDKAVKKAEHSVASNRVTYYDPAGIKSLKESFKSLKNMMKKIQKHPMAWNEFRDALKGHSVFKNCVVAINEQCYRAEQYFISPYLKPCDVWPKFEDAIVSILSLESSPHRLAPQKKKMAHSPVIALSVAKKTFPKGLIKLMKAIYTMWQQGGIVDERSDTLKEDRHKRSKIPGSLRSWHANDKGYLPKVNFANDKRSRSFFDYYLKMSRSGDHSNIREPIGYAEYTGIVIGSNFVRDVNYDYRFIVQGDHQPCRLVFNYEEGYMYLTVSHYTCFKIDSDNQVVLSSDSGYKLLDYKEHNPFFCIDMTA